MEKEEEKTCPHCNGKGKVEEFPDGMFPMMIRCWVCGGSGSVSLEKYEDYKK